MGTAPIPIGGNASGGGGAASSGGGGGATGDKSSRGVPGAGGAAAGVQGGLSRHSSLTGARPQAAAAKSSPVGSTTATHDGSSSSGNPTAAPNNATTAREHKQTQQHLLAFRSRALQVLTSHSLAAELEAGQPAQATARALDVLGSARDAATQAIEVLGHSGDGTTRAVAHFVDAWAQAKLAELGGAGTSTPGSVLSDRLASASHSFDLAVDALGLGEPPARGEAPSVVRPHTSNHHLHGAPHHHNGGPHPLWVGDLLAERARCAALHVLSLMFAAGLDPRTLPTSSTTTTTATSSSGNTTSTGSGRLQDADVQALLDRVCSLNAHAIITPLEPNPADEALYFDDFDDDPGDYLSGPRIGGGGAGASRPQGGSGVRREAHSTREHAADGRTVLGTARLLRDLDLMHDWQAPSSAPSAANTSQVAGAARGQTLSELWTARLAWHTHAADVRFTAASVAARQVVELAAQHSQILREGGLGMSPLESSRHNAGDREEMRETLQRTLRRMIPFELQQGSSLRDLGRVMLEAVWALDCGKDSTFAARRRAVIHGGVAEPDDDGDEALRDAQHEQDAEKPAIPESELVQETRMMLGQAIAHFENAYAAFNKVPPKGGDRVRVEQRILRKLEAAYCELEELDNDTPAVQDERLVRVERAMFINDRLVALEQQRQRQLRRGREDEGEDEGEDEDKDEDDELQSDTDDEDADDAEVAGGFGRDIATELAARFLDHGL